MSAHIPEGHLVPHPPYNRVMQSPEAYHWLRREAMGRRLRLGKVAQMLLSGRLDPFAGPAPHAAQDREIPTN